MGLACSSSRTACQQLCSHPESKFNSRLMGRNVSLLSECWRLYVKHLPSGNGLDHAVWSACIEYLSWRAFLVPVLYTTASPSTVCWILNIFGTGARTMWSPPPRWNVWSVCDRQTGSQLYLLSWDSCRWVWHFCRPDSLPELNVWTSLLLSMGQLSPVGWYFLQLVEATSSDSQTLQYIF